MPEQRRKFSPQFKAEAVQLVLETGRPIAAVATVKPTGPTCSAGSSTASTTAKHHDLLDMDPPHNAANVAQGTGFSNQELAAPTSLASRAVCARCGVAPHAQDRGSHLPILADDLRCDDRHVRTSSSGGLTDNGHIRR